MCVCVCVCVQSLSCVQLLETPWTVAHQAPLSMGFLRQEYWSGLPFPSPGDPPNPGMSSCISCIGRWILYHWVTWEMWGPESDPVLCFCDKSVHWALRNVLKVFCGSSGQTSLQWDSWIYRDSTYQGMKLWHGVRMSHLMAEREIRHTPANCRRGFKGRGKHSPSCTNLYFTLKNTTVLRIQTEHAALGK